MMWHQQEKNSRKISNMGIPTLSSRRHSSGGLMTFVTLLLFATLATLVWNYEGVQRLVKLLPTDGFYSGAKHPTNVLTPISSAQSEVIPRQEIPAGSDASKNDSDATVPHETQSLQPLVVPLTILEGAVAEGAVCLDGSPPGYHLHEGNGGNARNWVLFLEEGAWCESEAACKVRARAHLGSSKWMNDRTFEGILSNSEEVNPDFYNWNRVFVRYCDGASFSGNSSLPTKTEGNALHYRGESIWNFVIDDLLKKGLNKVEKALLGGCSAGGLSSILHCDKLRTVLPRAKVVKCMSDAGFFVDMKTYKGENKIQTYFKNVVDLHNVSGTLPEYCTETRNSVECFFPQYLISEMKTPLFVVNGAYDWWQMDNIVAPDPLGEWDDCKNNAISCTNAQLEIIQGYRKELLEALKPIQNSKKHGMFVDGCFHHCQASYDAFWSGPHAPHVKGKTASQALGDWYFERDTTASSVIDCAYPCNPTCPPKTSGRLSVGRPSFRNWS
ncbi:pectin acetylesterase 7 isoform X2 [Physcomitrium patens]|nr:pectin acetylesterase 7-like isoform X2 [Physcomitrium patens]|eukprot:XP_024381508.1 pectin acetylesterase 7-like isoform X2 [Physcomitrella patens]